MLKLTRVDMLVLSIAFLFSFVAVSVICRDIVSGFLVAVLVVTVALLGSEEDKHGRCDRKKLPH